MADRPIIFSAPMVQALLAGRKTQTRRVLKPSGAAKGCGYTHLRLDVMDGMLWWWDGKHDRVGASQAYPYSPGDRLWVREAFRGSKNYDTYPPHEWSRWAVHYEADGAPDPRDDMHMNGRLRPSIHMPRWASRLTLHVTDVRVQRLQEISGADAKAEGVSIPAHLPEDGADLDHARRAFRSLWNSLHGADAWRANPWVCAITFIAERANIDQARSA